jgi:SprT protein
LKQSDLSSRLAQYIPAEAAPFCADLIIKYAVHVKITRVRSTKYGDYTPPFNGAGHRITISFTTNKYSFLVTLLHELAHMLTHEKYFHPHVAPHGEEWKSEFRKLLHNCRYDGIFPPDLNKAIINYANNPAASSCSDPGLIKALRKYGKDSDSSFLLEELPENSIFTLSNGKKFKKGQKLRKRFECIELSSKKLYLVDALAEVVPEVTPSRQHK